MTIYHLFKEKSAKRQLEERPAYTETFELEESLDEKKKDSLFSSLVTRFFFFLLLLADIVWGAYALLTFIISLAAGLITGFRLPLFKRWLAKAFLMLKRCMVCALSLFVGFFSPAFGIMVACTYFLMYDKTGIEEVIPASLQDQFKDIFNPS